MGWFLYDNGFRHERVKGLKIQSYPTIYFLCSNAFPGWNFGVINLVTVLFIHLNPLSATPTKWPNPLKQFVGK